MLHLNLSWRQRRCMNAETSSMAPPLQLNYQFISLGIYCQCDLLPVHAFCHFQGKALFTVIEKRYKPLLCLTVSEQLRSLESE